MFNSSRQVREQSLSQRGPVLGQKSWGKLFKKLAIDFGIGTAGTVAGYALLDKITGPSKPAAPVTVPATSRSGVAPAPTTDPNNGYPANNGNTGYTSYNANSANNGNTGTHYPTYYTDSGSSLSTGVSGKPHM